MIRRTASQRTIAMFAVALVIYPWSDTARAGSVVVSGTVNQSGSVMEGATAIANPPGPDETQMAIEIDLEALRALIPNSSIGEASLSLKGVRFDVPKTIEVRTYGADVALTVSDFNEGGDGQPIFSHMVTEPTGPDGLNLMFPVTDFHRAPGIGFNLRESESSGNALVSIELVFLGTLLVLGLLEGSFAVRQGTEPELGPGGIPTGNLVFLPPELTFTPVPEPASCLLLLLGALLVVSLRRRLAVRC
jgi:hypothetical protein